ncbi:MAG: PepSY-like domain-containing protein [Bacteroidaceae bacterium]|nr:PepSY-like domain-containing protein [Bacteroidaceae bacterium]
MKRTAYLLVVLFLSLSVMAEDIEIKPEQLPEKAMKVIKEAYPDAKIKEAVIERRASLMQYEVKLSGGVKMQFRKDGSFTECVCTEGTVPAVLIPQKIRVFLSKEFPQREVVRIEHDSKLFELTLDNGDELCFNSSFRLIDIDHAVE